MARPKRRNRKGSGQVVRSGRNWGIRYTENGVRKYVGGYPTKDAAAQALESEARRVSDGLPGATQAAAGPAPRFVDLVDEWLEYRLQNLELRSTPDDRNRWDNHVDPFLGTRTIDQIDSGVLAGLVGAMKGKGVGPATIERVLHLLSAFFKWARTIRKVTTLDPVKQYLADIGPPARSKLRSQHRPEDTQFIASAADVAKVYQGLSGSPAIAYALSALSGMRPGEVLALRWSDIDLDAGTANVRRQVRHGKVSVPKSGKGRIVPLVAGLVSELRSWRTNNPEAELVCPPIAQELRDGTTKARVNRHGEAKWLNRRTIASELSRALAAAGLPEMTFYEAGRHSFGALWVLRGLDVYRLSKILGHSSVNVTARYAHLSAKTPADVLAQADIQLTG